MKFDSVEKPEQVDLSLPEDHPETGEVLANSGDENSPSVYVGCAKWNRKDLKDFYPHGTKDELAYYSSQFNSVELNAAFYTIFEKEPFEKWRDKVSDDFKFFPKVNRYIIHLKWLNDIEERTDKYIDSISHFKENLGNGVLAIAR